MTTREVTTVHAAHRQEEGAGFIVRRPFPSYTLDAIDPFLLLDELGPVEYGPGQAKGAPDHPHRGFETVSYMLEGEMEHEDSAGHRGVLRSGDVQWMTAGAGIIHSEMPSGRVQAEGGRAHGFQIWVNLPSKLKMMTPRYQEIAAAKIPVVTTQDGNATGRIIAGEALGTTAVIDVQTPIIYQDWSLSPGADVSLTLAADLRAFVYVFEGSVRVGDRGDVVPDGSLALLAHGDVIRLRGEPGGGRLLLLGGAPIGEPIARYGPFVMNTEAELQQAFADFRSGKMGEITRTARQG